MAKQVRIAGLVRAAEMVRRELSAPTTAEQRERLRKRVESNILAVQRILREEGGKITDIPAPSQRAYLFLAGLDWQKLGMANNPPGVSGEPASSTSPEQPDAFFEDTPQGQSPSSGETDGVAGPPLGKIAWRGLNAVLDRAVEALADEIPEHRIDGIGASIARASRLIEFPIQRNSFSPDRFSPETRACRGWLAFFSQAENLKVYLESRRRASCVLDAAAVGSRHYPPPLTIYFRPMQGIYKLRRTRSEVRLSLPTPMIVFGDAGFVALASLIYDRGAGTRQQVIELMTSDNYQTVRAELESLGGIVEQSRGAIHDLAASFDRINAGYFDGKMARPTLTWNRTFTGRKFGHYDFVHDTLMVSRTLDSSDVPAFVVDFLVFHELLHKYHGLHWVNGRGYAHTSEFQRDERKFARYEEAEAVLKKLAMSVR